MLLISLWECKWTKSPQKKKCSVAYQKHLHHLWHRQANIGQQTLSVFLLNLKISLSLLAASNKRLKIAK
jgi:hypothetical protein